VLLISLFLPWFSVDLNENQTLCGAGNILDFLLLATPEGPLVRIRGESSRADYLRTTRVCESF
jgi:hypothetical protein